MTTKDTLFALFDSCNSTRIVLLLLSYCFITFGQPAYSPLAAAFASTVGYSLLFYELAKLTTKARFIYGTLFFFFVQCVQLFWFTYHPVVAARSTFLLLSILMGVQFGILCLFVTKKIICSKRLFLLIPAVWTILEWSRIYWCSGFYFNLSGIALAGNIITLQSASLFGVLGMSFWVMLTNTAILRAFYLLKTAPILLAFCIGALPFIYGMIHLQIHTSRQTAYDAIYPKMKVLIVHSRKVPEEFLPQPRKRLSPQERAYNAWKELVEAIAPFYNQEKLDLILMPEGVVPYGSATLLFNTVEINSLFLSTIRKPFALTSESLLTSEDIAREIAHLYKCPLIIGLEGVKRTAADKPQYYNSAFFFSNNPRIPVQRYDKQVLVPMGEYIPCDFAKKWAAKYGIFDSFTPGSGAHPFESGIHRIGASVCYEETVGSLMRQNSEAGATLLVNLTDDYWFPYSMLAIQHYEHARPRTVENGVPLIRSCNFGISGVIDSLGRPVCVKEGTAEPTSFIVSFSSYHYKTLYGFLGDIPVLAVSCIIILIGLCSFLRYRK